MVPRRIETMTMRSELERNLCSVESCVCKTCSASSQRDQAYPPAVGGRLSWHTDCSKGADNWLRGSAQARPKFGIFR
jgi:hypothetical protein